MIKIIPEFIEAEVIQTFLKQIDYSKKQKYLGNETVEFISPIKYPEINKNLRQFGNFTNVELLVYNKGSYMGSHTDACSFDGDSNWVQTGILYLNSPSEYDGGELCFNNINFNIKPNERTLIIFPAGPNTESFAHSVNVVTSGKRLCLVYRFSCG